jgi:heavy metal sensor kinase
MTLAPHSIRWRMQLWHGALLAIVLAAFAITAWRFAWADQMRRVDAELQQQIQTMLGMMHNGPERPPRRPGQDNPFLPPPLFDDDRPPPPRGGRSPEDLQAWADVPGPVSRFFKAWAGPENDVVEAGGALAMHLERPEADEDVDQLTPVSRNTEVLGRSVREMVEFAPRGVALIAGRTLEPELNVMHALAWKLALAGGGVWLLAFFGGGWLTKRALRPIKSITTTATRISSGNLNERINVEEADSELGQLASVLNDTFARLHQSFEQQAQFTADAAHELRTPLSVLLSQTQLALSRERSPEDYRETLEACQRSAKRMHALTESLLELARLDGQTGAPKHEPTDLALIATECIDHLRPLAEAHGIQLQSDLSPSAVRGDAGQLVQVLTNVLSNAVHHSPDGSAIRVTTGRQDGEVFARVMDEGPGIAAEHLPHLFDRFYRAEASRNRNTGGAGLGLAICQTIAHAHGGRMTVESEVGKGSTFAIVLPGMVASA